MVATAKIAPTIDIRELVTGTGPFGPSEIRGLTQALGNNASAHRDVRGAVRELEQMTDQNRKKYVGMRQDWGQMASTFLDPDDE